MRRITWAERVDADARLAVPPDHVRPLQVVQNGMEVAVVILVCREEHHHPTRDGEMEKAGSRTWKRVLRVLAQHKPAGAALPARDVAPVLGAGGLSKIPSKIAKFHLQIVENREFQSKILPGLRAPSQPRSRWS